VKGKTPYGAWSGMKPEVTHFCIFGSHAWAHIPSKKRKAMKPQSKECIFVGYPEGVKGYRLIDPSTYNLIIERSVWLEESPLHASREQHAETSSLPLVADHRDYVSCHLD
jgi:hypothetical protein